MSQETKPTDPHADQGQANEFLSAASGKQQGLIGEFIGFMRDNKAWWLTPILVVIGLVGVLLLFGTTGASAFLYSFF